MTVRLATREAGEGDPLILMHGLFGSSRNWVGVQKSLASRHQVISLDLRNHGSSGRDPAMDYEVMAADVQAMLHERGLADVTMLGHSMGGKVAMTVALREPALVARLIVVDIAPVRYPPHHTTIVAALRALDLATLHGRADADLRLQAGVPDNVVRGFLLQNLVQESAQWTWRINLDAIANGLEALGDFPAASGAAPFPKPTLFLCGGASDYVTPANHADIERLFPRADIQTIAGAGHWPHAEVPADFLARVTAFLQATGS